jgi:uncharacterized protein YgiM (DUF1202 family)
MKKLLILIPIFLIAFVACKKTSSDKTAPIITLTGSAEVYSQKDSTYVDAGATASDDIDGDISSSIVVSNPVNIHTESTYWITYNVSDKAGNQAAEVKRKVIVMIF